MGQKRGFFASFVYAYQGVRHAVETQRNMRFHISMTILVSAFSHFYRLNSVEWMSLLFAITFVMVCEMFNTAVENAVDVATQDYHEKAKIAKDVAAGAVMFASVLAVIVASVLFLHKDRLVSAFALIFSNWVYAGSFFVLAVVLGWWIFWYRSKK